LVLFGQGYHGITAAGKYWVEGIIDLRIPMMNNTLIYIQLEDAQQLFGAEERLTHLSLMINEPKELLAIQANLQNELDSNTHRVMNWKEMNADYVQMASSKDISSGIMIGILYLIVGFGIFGTLFMMTLERRREFSVMIAIGMKRLKLSAVVFIESLFLGMVGGITGIGMSLPLLGYLSQNPIPLSGDIAEMYEAYGVEPEYHFAFEADFIVNQFMVIFILCVLLSVVPIISINRLNFVNALRGR
jgi:ABC-type lipoprotein release transport system permease subunit